MGLGSGRLTIRRGATGGLGGKNDGAAVFRQGMEDLPCPIHIDLEIRSSVTREKDSSREDRVGGIHPFPSRGIWWERGHAISRKAFAKKLLAKLFWVSDRRKNARALPQFLEEHITTYEAGCPGQKQRFHSSVASNAKAARRAIGVIGSRAWWPHSLERLRRERSPSSVSRSCIFRLRFSRRDRSLRAGGYR